jgi:ribosomal-protein-alanine N-acetyltransferase
MSKVEYAKQLESTWRIAHMTEHDLHEVVEIEESCGLSCWGWEAYHDELVNGHASLMLVARYHPANIHAEEKHLAGFVASRLIADELHINNIAVRPDSRRQGIGDALLSGVLDAGAKVGARSALLEVRASNQSAQALYAGHGFRIAGRRAGYYSAPPEDALVMRASVGS